MTGDRPTCSVIMPAYNAEAFIKRSVASVQAQTMPAWELIVVDDGSTDGTASLVEAMADPRIQIVRQENAGPSAARNRGLAESAAEFVLFLDSDDCLTPDALARLTAPLQNDPALTVAYGEAVAVGADGQRGVEGGPLLAKRPSGKVLVALAAQNFVVSPGVLCARREVCVALGGFDTALHVSEDWVFWCRLAAHGPFAYVGPVPVLEYTVREQSVARSRGLDPAYTLACVEAVFQDGPISEQLGRARERLYRRARASALGFTATQHLRLGSWRQAQQLFLMALSSDPTRLRNLLLLGFAIARCFPNFLRKRIK